MAERHSSIRVGTSLFDDLLRAGVAVNEAEHLSTLTGLTARVQAEEFRGGLWWSLVVFQQLNLTVWLPTDSCLMIPEPKKP